MRIVKVKMKKIKLNTNQISDLINNNRIYLEHNKTIEIFDDNIIINYKDRITTIESLQLEYIENNQPTNFLQGIICDYFNCELCNVICTQMSIQEAVFRIKFSQQKELSIIVVSSDMAAINMKHFIEEPKIENYITKNQIGFYHRLGNSDYFFRWNDDFM